MNETYKKIEEKVQDYAIGYGMLGSGLTSIAMTTHFWVSDWAKLDVFQRSEKMEMFIAFVPANVMMGLMGAMVGGYAAYVVSTFLCRSGKVTYKGGKAVYDCASAVTSYLTGNHSSE